MAQAGTAFVGLQFDPGDVSKLKAQARGIGSGAGSSASSGYLSTFKRVAVAAGGITAIYKGFQFAKGAVIDFNSQLEQARGAFTNLFASQPKADALLKQLQDFAATTPFAFGELIPLSQQLLGSLGKSTNVIPIMRQLGDAISATGGSAAELGMLTRAYSQMATSGKANLQDLMQINNAVPGSMSKMAEASGMSIGKFREYITSGALTSAKAVALFKKVTTDPKYGIAGGMEVQSKTFAGAMSNIGDAATQMLAQAGKPLYDFISRAAKGFAHFLAVMQKVGFMNALRLQLGGIAVAGITFNTALDFVIGSFKTMISIGGSVVGFFMRNKDILLALVGVYAAVKVAMLVHRVFLALQAVWTLGATIAQAGLNATMMAFPAFFIIAGIALLVGGLILLYSRSETFRKVVQSVFGFVRHYIPVVLGAVKSVIMGFVGAVMGFWHRFGSAIMATTRTYWAMIKGVIGGALTVIKGIIKVFTGVLHGNWSQAWSGLKDIVRGSMKIMASIIRGFLTILLDIGKRLGKALIDGIVSGLAGLKDAVLGKLKSGIGGAIDGAKGFLGIGSPSKYMRDHIGVPLAQGVEQGFVDYDLTRPIHRALAGAAAGLGTHAAFAGAAPAAMGTPEIRIFIGDREITDIVRVEVGQAQQRTARAVRAGRKWAHA